MEHIIWKQSEKNWLKLAMVKLHNAISSQSWFDGTISFGWSNSSYEQAEKELKKYSGNKPERLSVRQKYQSTIIAIDVLWSFDNDRYEMEIDSPTTVPEFLTFEGKPKVKSSQYLEGMVKRIEAAINAAKPEADKLIAQKIAKEVKKKKNLEYKDDLCEELGVSLEMGWEGNEFAYGKKQDFGMRFYKDDPDDEDDKNEEESFVIEAIKGNFTKKQIKQFIQLVGGNPRAIAARLANK